MLLKASEHKANVLHFQCKKIKKFLYVLPIVYKYFYSQIVLLTDHHHKPYTILSSTTNLKLSTNVFIFAEIKASMKLLYFHTKTVDI
jgi:hypothetical protein